MLLHLSLIYNSPWFLCSIQYCWFFLLSKNSHQLWFPYHHGIKTPLSLHWLYCCDLHYPSQSQFWVLESLLHAPLLFFLGNSQCLALMITFLQLTFTYTSQTSRHFPWSTVIHAIEGQIHNLLQCVLSWPQCLHIKKQHSPSPCPKLLTLVDFCQWYHHFFDKLGLILWSIYSYYFSFVPWTHIKVHVSHIWPVLRIPYFSNLWSIHLAVCQDHNTIVLS